MRLLHSKSLELKEFVGRRLPPYAILSHTWGEGEVSFQDLQTGEAPTKAGYQKILRCCEEAARDGFEYAWVDTCCIDKTSSSELSEAINSMYRWYKEAAVCYVYLSDISDVSPIQSNLKQVELALSNSRWFTRGWTLQELIAPSSLIFYNNSWEEIGTKSSLRTIISHITGMQLEVISGASLEDFSVAQRMSWAANRETTRVEDLAYCLMGIFGVNMPMLYGEGDRAFIRLQEEIIKVSDDDSIFAWKAPNWQCDGGLLAPFPKAFAASVKVMRGSHASSYPFALTNKGIKVQMRSKYSEDENSWVAILNSEVSGEKNKFIGILFKEIASRDQQFMRDQSQDWVMVTKHQANSYSTTEMYIRAERQEKSASVYTSCLVETSALGEYGFSLEKIWTPGLGAFGSKDANMVKIMYAGNLSLPTGGVLKIGDIHGVPFLVIIKKEGSQFVVSLGQQAIESESFEELFYWFRNPYLKAPSSSASSQKKALSNVPDRVSWRQPNRRWVVSVAIKRQIVGDKRAHVVMITGRTPFKKRRKA